MKYVRHLMLLTLIGYAAFIPDAVCCAQAVPFALVFMGSPAHAEVKVKDKDKDKPNIILFFVDDNVVEAIKDGGLCPNIDSLAEGGITFTRAYTPHGVCGPARFAVLSGRYMSRCIETHCLIPESRIHGSTAMGGLTVEGQRFIWSGSITSREWNVAKLMKRGGYTTFYTGKVHGHMQDAPVDEQLERDAKTDPWKAQELMRKKLQQAGWDWAEALSKGNITNHGRKVNGVLAASHHPEWRAKATIDFIDKHHRGPFFCYIAENLMHSPPPVEDMRKDPRIAFDGIIFDEPLEVMPSRKSVFERIEAAGLDEKMAPLLWLDDMVGAILRKLEDEGLRDNTLIAFVQDNGHRWDGKNTVYEGGIHLSPTFVSWPAGQKNPGRKCDQLISSLDFIPTFMEAAGVDAPDDLVLDGTSLMPIIRGANEQPLRESVYAEMGHTRAVVTRKWKYIALRVPDSRRFTAEEKELFRDRVRRDPTGVTEMMGCRETQMQNSDPGYVPSAWYTHRDHFFDEDQLYDLEDDPAELVNLAGRPQYAEVLKGMKRRLRQYCLQLPGTFAEFKTVDDCPAEFTGLLKRARAEPLVPVSKGRKSSNKMPKPLKR